MGTCLQSQKQTEFKPISNVPVDEEENLNTEKMIETLLFGYIRSILSNIEQFHIIPLDVISLCCDYYGKKWTTSIYQISLDRYGFPLQISNNPQQKYTVNDDEIHRKKLRLEQQLLDKYMQLLYGKNMTSTNQSLTHDIIINNNKLKSLIRNHGIPQQLRGIFWPALLNIAHKKQCAEILIESSLYETLINNNKHPYPGGTLKSINRIYRKHSRFGMSGMEKQLNYAPTHLYKIKIQNMTNNLYLYNYEERKDRDAKDLLSEQIKHFFMNCTDTQKHIWNITKAFQLFKPELGMICCGGLFQIAPFLLLFMTQENVFWCLISLVENSDKYLWVPESTPWKLYFYCVERMVAKYLSKINAHFITNDIFSASLYQATYWFATIFIVANIGNNFEALTRIWDLYLLDGGIIIYKAGLGLLKYYKADILSAASFEELLELFGTFGKGKDFDVERYFKIIKAWKFTLSDLNKIVNDYYTTNNQINQ